MRHSGLRQAMVFVDRRQNVRQNSTSSIDCRNRSKSSASDDRVATIGCRFAQQIPALSAKRKRSLIAGRAFYRRTKVCNAWQPHLGRVRAPWRGEATPEQRAAPGIDEVDRAGVAAVDEIERDAVSELAGFMRSPDQSHARRAEEGQQRSVHAPPVCGGLKAAWNRAADR